MTATDLIVWLIWIIIGYFIITFSLALLLWNIPRRPIDDHPDWGLTKDYRVPAINGKTMECWVVYPDKLKEETDESILKKNKIPFKK